MKPSEEIQKVIEYIVKFMAHHPAAEWGIVTELLKNAKSEAEAIEDGMPPLETP